MDSVQSMASSSSSTGPSSERTSHFISQTEMEMESSKARHWSQLDYSTSDSEWSASQTEMEMQSSKARHWSQVDYSTTDSEWSAETNFKDFALLKKNPQWGRFFKDFEALEVGEKISGGAQADIYEARNKRDGPYNLVVKVMKGDAPLQAFQAQWPIGMLSTRALITILGGTVLHDQRLRGRFAFVMFRRWGDLRLLIDRRMKQKCNTLCPFPLDEAIHLMLRIAEDVRTLHNKHDILHRDLKASNVLVWGEFGKDISPIPPLGQVEKIESLVTDFECSLGVLGTGFWRAPEILEQVKARVPSSKVHFTRASDVYSYGIICYEIVTGCIPFDGLGGEDMISQILQGRRPKLPHDLPKFIRDIIVGCWHSDPSERPSFSDICEALILKRGLYLESVDIDNKSKRHASIVKVEQCNSSQALTLLEVMQKLIDMDLSVLKASQSSSTTMILHYFEVTDCQGKKVVNDKSIAYITKVLKSLSSQILNKKESSDNETLEMERANESTSIDENEMSVDGISMDEITNVKMHVLEDENIDGDIDGDIDGNTIVQMHVLKVIAKRSAFLLENLSTLLVSTNFRIHSAGCWTREGRVECVVYVEGARMGSFLWKLRHNMEYFPKSLGRFRIIIHRVATKELSHLTRCMHDLKSMDLTCPRSSSDICVHQSKGFSLAPQVVVCLEKRCWLVDVSRNFTNMDYKIYRALVKYLGPYEFMKGRGKRSEEINLTTYQSLGLNKAAPVDMIAGILDIATKRKCPGVNAQLIVSGPSEKLLHDLVRSLRENDLVATGGQVYGEIRESGTRSFTRRFIPHTASIEFFVTEKLAMKVG